MQQVNKKEFREKALFEISSTLSRVKSPLVKQNKHLPSPQESDGQQLSCGRHRLGFHSRIQKLKQHFKTVLGDDNILLESRVV